jgi:putative transposase
MAIAKLLRRKRNDSAAEGLGRIGCRYGRNMPRKPRAFVPGTPTQITARGVDEGAIFLSDLDRYELLGLLRDVTELLDLDVLCWCLMTTHYHLYVVCPDDPARLSWAMLKVNSVYAREFNRRHRRRGHLFGARFTDTVTQSDGHGRRTISYILDNPVRARMVKRFDEWNWSGLETLRPRDEFGTLAPRNRNTPVRLAG